MRLALAGVQAWAEQAAGHVEEVATFRAGGLLASVRTIAHCGFTGTVAYSLIGDPCSLSCMGSDCPGLGLTPLQPITQEICAGLVSNTEAS